MPGIHYPSSPRSIFVRHSDNAVDFLSLTYPTLLRHERSSNIVLAHALKLVSAETALTGLHFTDESDARNHILSSRVTSSAHKNRRNSTEPFWVTVWSAPSPHDPPTLDLALSCVNWTLGEYPIFLWTPKTPSAIHPSWLDQRMEALIQHLWEFIPPSRVFSVFGPTKLAKSFSSLWSDYTGLETEKIPFYAAYYTYCNRSTFRAVQDVLPHGDSIRRANMGDLNEVAQLCKEFADESVYFPLTLERGMVEANELISKGLIWIYEADGEVTTICAVTRSSQNVSAITKAYTTPRWRRRGYAEHLVRSVTRRLLIDCGKSTVTLYVGHSNSAQRVYDRVGFVGLCGKDKPMGVEDALEIGFKTGAPRGHW
ncbi:hypothetical protein OF83DRAFT_1063249 [Amylostereum chailletii]|nr:hypothetical protein OF83DRAFT_1063249 [Amylostereum chailletii]